MAAKEGDGELRPLGFATGDRSRSQSREGGGGRDSRETSRDYRDLPSGEREGEREMGRGGTAAEGTPGRRRLVVGSR
jgi:hypothetical protein